jgi:hypothetical protein
MSRVAILGNASGSGTFTIASPNSNEDRTLTLPNTTGTIHSSGSSNELPVGSESTPSLFLTGSSNTGIFFPSGNVAISVNGTKTVESTPQDFRSYKSVQGIGGEEPAFNAGLTTSTLSSSYNYILGGWNDTGYKCVMFINGSTRSGDGGANVLTLRNDGGGLRLGSTSYVTTTLSSSDYRAKHSVTPYNSALNDVLSVPVIKFKYINDESQKIYSGFFAHELQKVAPYAVENNKDDMNEDGTPLYQGVDLQKVVPILWKAVQELKEELDVAKAKIATLEGEQP